MDKEDYDYAIKLCEEAGVCLEDGNTHGAAFALGSLAHFLTATRAKHQAPWDRPLNRAMREKLKELKTHENKPLKPGDFPSEAHPYPWSK